MTVSLIILSILAVTGVLLYLHDRMTRPATSENETESDKQTGNAPEACCGMHLTCEKDSLSTAVSDEIIYYDDEELDSFIGRSPESYTEDETEQFRDILLTLLPEDIAGWGRSLQLRHIDLPPAVKDELLMIVAEARMKINADSQ